MKKEKKQNYKKIAKITALVLGAYVLSLFLPLISPYSQLPLYVIKCGGLPIVASKFAAGWDYHLPSDENYTISPFNAAYFCSEGEAQASGYHRFSR